MARKANVTTDESGKVEEVTSETISERMEAASSKYEQKRVGGFAVGDIVRPKAGGPNGTVESLEASPGRELEQDDPNGIATVVWFSKAPNGEWQGPNRSTFPVAGLEAGTVEAQ